MTLYGIRHIRRSSLSSALDVDPVLSRTLDAWPHLKELHQSYTADLVFATNKYGHFDSIPPPAFEHNQFDGDDLVRSLLHYVADSRFVRSRRPHSGLLDSNGHSQASTSENSTAERPAKRYGNSPLLAYDPAFNWEVERATIPGQRVKQTASLTSASGLRFSVRVVSLSMQAGLVEPVYGTVCLYHPQQREKLSEDFHFQFLPPDFPGESTSPLDCAIFSLDRASTSICLLVQLERPATEDGGVGTSVYCRKDPSYLQSKEQHMLREWSRMMPFREAFAYATIPLFDPTVTGGVGGFGAPMAPSPPSGVHTPSSDVSWSVAESPLDDEGGPPVTVDVPELRRIKEPYTEEMILLSCAKQDPKRKNHKAIRATMKFEIERLSQEWTGLDMRFSRGTLSHRPDPASRVSWPRSLNWEGELPAFAEVSKARSNSDERVALGTTTKPSTTSHKVLDFRSLGKNKPHSQLLHSLYVYPQSVISSKKRNLFIRIELRDSDADLSRLPLEAICPKGPGSDHMMLRRVYTQVASSSKTALFHDEIKVRMPAVLLPQHHLLFTFLHVELKPVNGQAPKPVVVGYAVLNLSYGAMLLRSDGTLPIANELKANYLSEHVKQGKMSYWEEGKPVFRVRLRLCSSIHPTNSTILDFLHEYDRQVLAGPGAPVGSELLEAINNLKSVEPVPMMQFLQPTFNMLLRMIGTGAEQLQVAAFRSMVGILTRVQQESPDGGGGERNRYLVHYVDFAYDDLNGREAPVYPGLCSVWRSLARSKAKGYRVGPVYDDALTMSWVFLEIIAKSLALQHSRNSATGKKLEGGQREERRPFVLKEEVSKCVFQLFECLVMEVIERSRKALPLARRLNASLAFFCYDLLSVVDPRQVFELITLYVDKIGSDCPAVLQECKLLFLRNVCDHDLLLELPPRGSSAEQSFLTTLLIQQLVLAMAHEDPAMHSRAARMLAFFMCKHEFDARYQKPEDKRYIASLYWPLIDLILGNVEVYLGLKQAEKREVLVCILSILHHSPPEAILQIGHESAERTRLFFNLLEDCVSLFEHKSMAAPAPGQPLDDDDGGGMYAPASYDYTEILSPSMNAFFNQTNKQDAKATLEAIYMLKRSPGMSPRMEKRQMILRDAVEAGQVSRREARRMLRDSLHPELKYKLEMWEGSLSVLASLSALDVAHLYSAGIVRREIQTDYERLDILVGVLSALLARRQSLSFWETFLHIFDQIMAQNGGVLLGNENNRFLKDLTFFLMKAAVSAIEFVRKRAVVAIQLMLRVGFATEGTIRREAVALTITFSELLSEIGVLDLRETRPLGPHENPEAARLRISLLELGTQERCMALLAEVGLRPGTLQTLDESGVDRWRWDEVLELRSRLSRALEASVEHSRLMGSGNADRHLLVESHNTLAWSYVDVPDLHIMWLLQLCEVHQEQFSWAEAGQCAVAVAASIIHAIVEKGDEEGQAIWSEKHLRVLHRMCPVLSVRPRVRFLGAQVEGYGASKLTVDTAVKWLQTANKFFHSAELYHFCADLLKLTVPVHKVRGTYSQMPRVHTSLMGIYEEIVQQEADPIPFKDANYYRVGFYGSRFGRRLDRKEFVYREPREVRLGDMMEKLGHSFGELLGTEVSVIPDSRTVNYDELKPSHCYLQITSVEPLPNDDPDSNDSGEAAKQRVLAGEPPLVWVARPAWRHFLFDTPFTKNGTTQGGLADQWKRRTVLTVEGCFPALVNRQLVVASEQREFSPAENAVSMIKERTWAIKTELEGGGHGQGTLEARLQPLQRVLQGSVAVQVNSGVLGVCVAFLKRTDDVSRRAQAPTPSGGATVDADETPPPSDREQLTAAILDFMEVCSCAIAKHEGLISEEDHDFHQQLVAGFSSLRSELSHFIPSLAV